MVWGVRTLWPDILNCKVCSEQGFKGTHIIYESLCKSIQHLLRSSENAVLGKMSRGSPLPLPLPAPRQQSTVILEESFNQFPRLLFFSLHGSASECTVPVGKNAIILIPHSREVRQKDAGLLM